MFPLFCVDHPKEATARRASSLAPRCRPHPQKVLHGHPGKGSSRPDGSVVNASEKWCTVNGVRWTPIVNNYQKVLLGHALRVVRAPLSDCSVVLLRGLSEGHHRLNGQPFDLVCLVDSACRSRRCRHHRLEPVPPARDHVPSAQRASPRPDVPPALPNPSGVGGVMHKPSNNAPIMCQKIKRYSQPFPPRVVRAPKIR